jgi:hypothetical protein
LAPRQRRCRHECHARAGKQSCNLASNVVKLYLARNRCHVIRRNAAAPLASTLVKVARRSRVCCSYLTQEHFNVDMRRHLCRGCPLGSISWSRFDRSVFGNCCARAVVCPHDVGQPAGMIMWPKAKRSVSDAVAASISAVATQHNSATVGVFVDEDAETIMRRCRAAGVGIAQLHGSESR